MMDSTQIGTFDGRRGRGGGGRRRRRLVLIAGGGGAVNKREKPYSAVTVGRADCCGHTKVVVEGGGGKEYSGDVSTCATVTVGRIPFGKEIFFFFAPSVFRI